jgi:hypothetical protein
MQSGMPDTSTGDSILNTIMKLAIHGVGHPWVSLINGDDSVTVTTLREIERLGGTQGLMDKYAEFGMEVKVKLCDNVLDVDYCSSRFLSCGTSFILMPKPGRLLAKIFTDAIDRNVEGQAAWMRGIAATLECYGKIDPLYSAIALSVRDQVGGGKTIEHVREYTAQVNPAHVNHVPTMQQLDAYYSHHYGMSSGERLELCATLRQTKLYQFEDHPLVMRLAVDAH